MTTSLVASTFSQYPAWCWSASPTYNAWAKLTAADVHALRAEPEYQGQNLYFHFNHPIRYVRLVGSVVAIDDINPKFTLFTLDDGSGLTIDIKIDRLGKEITSSVDCPSNTAVDNVNVITEAGIFDVLVDDQPLNIGTVVKIKCTISEFRGVRQLNLKRISIVKSTDEEVQAWAELAKFRQEVLSRPWRLSQGELQSLKEKANGERRFNEDRRLRRAEHEARKAEHRKKHAEKMKIYEEKAERRRRKEEVMFDAGALDKTRR